MLVPPVVTVFERRKVHGGLGNARIAGNEGICILLDQCVEIRPFGEIKPFVREAFLVLLISCAKARIRC